jgi:hypothetical protein
MKGNDDYAEDRRASGLPWYGRNEVWFCGLPMLALLVFLYLFYWPDQITPGPWQALDPGKPVEEPLKFEVVQEGTGTVVEVGDLVQLTLHWRSAQRRENDHTTVWWVWVGFRTAEETPFYAMNPRLLNSFIGQKEGTVMKFTESPSYIEEGGQRQMEAPSNHAGKVYVNPFGSYNYYAWKKSGYGKMSMPISVPTRSGHMDVYITQVFKGQLKYRTTRLYDDTWIRFCGGWFDCKFINNPREGWGDEARYDGVSADGRRATFQYGPVATPGKEWIRPGGNRSTLSVAGDWLRNEWQKLPVGVQVDCDACTRDGSE